MSDKAIHALITQHFSDQGLLAKNIPRFQPRESQSQMALRIADAITDQKILIAEAGTGTGKTFAYLVPALISGGRVIISTATKNLQEQLFQADLPRIINALGLPVSIALLKGRRNYLCHYHLERNLAMDRFGSIEDAKQLQQIKVFAQNTDDGDIAKCNTVHTKSNAWQLATASADNCLGTECPAHDRCFLMAARKKAFNADVIVVNHHLYFADVGLKGQKAGELLPSANVVIFDESHQIPDIAAQYFGLSISAGQIAEFARDLMRDGTTEAKNAADWIGLSQKIEQSLRELRLCALNWPNRLARENIPNKDEFSVLLGELIEILNEAVTAVEPHAAAIKSLESILQRNQKIIDTLTQWQAAKADNVFWLEVSANHFAWHRTPLEIGDVLLTHRAEAANAWIFTSATLSIKNQFSYFTSRLGLSEVECAQWDSPFDYQQNALLYVPHLHKQANEIGFNQALIDVSLPLIRALNGRTFILCTSHRAVADITQQLTELNAAGEIPWPILSQQQYSPNVLLQRFRQNPASILVGSYSFWEGVDVAGTDLQCVVIDKLPFVVPDDPVLVARLESLREQGKNGFIDYQVPEATIALRQGAGRLIRGEQDKGILLIADTRIVDKNYGKTMWRSLPPFRRTREAAIALEFATACQANPATPS